MHVLILHSSITNRRIFTNVFGKMKGVQVHVCAEDDLFLQQLNTCSPHLVIVQKELACVDDEKLLCELREYRRSDGLAVMIAAYEFTQKEAVDIIRKGADELLLLPFNADSLLKKINGLLRMQVTY